MEKPADAIALNGHRIIQSIGPSGSITQVVVNQNDEQESVIDKKGKLIPAEATFDIDGNMVEMRNRINGVQQDVSNPATGVISAGLHNFADSHLFPGDMEYIGHFSKDGKAMEVNITTNNLLPTVSSYCRDRDTGQLMDVYQIEKGPYGKYVERKIEDPKVIESLSKSMQDGKVINSYMPKTNPIPEHEVTALNREAEKLSASKFEVSNQQRIQQAFSVKSKF